MHERQICSGLSEFLACVRRRIAKKPSGFEQSRVEEVWLKINSEADVSRDALGHGAEAVRGRGAQHETIQGVKFEVVAVPVGTFRSMTRLCANADDAATSADSGGHDGLHFESSDHR